MDFELSDDQQQLAQSLDRVLREHCSFEKRRAIAATEAGWSEALWGHLAELGVTALGIPEAQCGLGGGAVDRLPVLQAFGAVQLLEPYLASCVLGATAVQAAGSPAQQEALLPAVAEGRARLAWAHEEAATRHAPLWVQTRARREGKGWRLTGTKSLVLGAAAATHWVVSARIEGEADSQQGLALFLVQPDASDALLRSYRLVDDTLAGELILDDVQAEALGDATDSACAAAAIRAVQAAGTAAACADMVGAMESAFALTTAYVNTRKQFGRAIGEYQAVRHRSADMAVALEMARSMAIAAASAADDPDAPGAALELARAKLVVGRHARALCEAAIQSHGGIGMTEEYAVGHCLRRVHVQDHLFGDVDAQAARLARLARPISVD